MSIFPKQTHTYALIIISLFFYFGLTFPVFGYSYSWDLQKHYPFAAAKLNSSDISEDMVLRMNQVDSNYIISRTIPDGSGISVAELQKLRNIAYVKYEIVRNAQTGIVTGKTIVLDIDRNYQKSSTPPGFNSDWLPDIITIDDCYRQCSKSQQAEIEQIYQDMVELWLNVECFPIDPKKTYTAGAYSWRKYGYKCLNMAHTLPNKVRQFFALSLFYSSGGSVLLGFNDTNDPDYGVSTDTYYTAFETMFRALSAMDDDAFKWQTLQTVCQQMDKVIVGNTGVNCIITLDGGIIHHWGHHISYADYSFLSIVKPHCVLVEAAITSPLTPQAIDRFRKAAIAWSWADTNGSFPVHFQLRPSFPSKSINGGKNTGKTVVFLKSAAELAAAYQYGDRSKIGSDLEMAYPAIIKAGQGSSLLPIQWQSITLPSESSDPQKNWTDFMQGHYTFQVNGSAIHRRNNWLVSIRGAHNFRRGGEGYDEMGKPDHFHGQSMRGSLLLITEGLNGRSVNCSDSGYYYEGWDHNYYPNVTNCVASFDQHLHWRTISYFSGGADYTGGANLFDNGVWFYVPSGGTQHKSAFFFDNRITLVTTGISYKNNGQTIVTGLIQQGHPDFPDYPITLDGTVYSGTGNWILTAGGDHKIIDAYGNGYYIHANASTPSIKAERGIQEWPYGLAKYWIGSGSMPVYSANAAKKEYFVNDVIASNFRYSKGNYSKVYFDHGTSPANESLVYTVLVKPDQGELDAFANDMNTTDKTPLKLETTSNRHVLYDVATNTYAAAVFTNNQKINQGGLVSVNRVGAYMWQNNGTTLRFSCGSSYLKDISPFVVVLSGHWYIKTQYDTDSVRVVYESNNNTIISLPYREFDRQILILTSIGGLQKSNENLTGK